jgi:hypothetical protein
VGDGQTPRESHDHVMCIAASSSVGAQIFRFLSPHPSTFVCSIRQSNEDNVRRSQPVCIDMNCRASVVPNRDQDSPGSIVEKEAEIMSYMPEIVHPESTIE